MSLRVGWNFGSTAEEECQDVVMQDSPCWTATSAVLKAGRGFSSWLFSNLSPPSSPLVSSFFCKDPFNSRQPPNAVCSPQLVERHTPYPSPTPSFIGTLPQELLEEIFREFLHGATATSPSSNSLLTGSFRRIITAPGTKTTPITLTHVCSCWRAIVMSNPSLWSKLCAFRPEHHDLPLFEHWLSLSSTCPLDLTIVQRGKGDAEIIDIATYQLLSKAVRHSNRWRTVTLRVDQDMESLLAGHSLGHIPFRHLQDFRLDAAGWSTDCLRTLSQLFFDSPVLKGAAWGAFCGISPFISEIPWAKLRTIQVGQINLVDLFTLLVTASSLQSLSIDFLETGCTTPFTSICQTTQKIHLSHLASLSLGSYNDSSPLFAALSLPALSSLTLKTGLGSIAISPHSFDAIWGTFRDFVRHSACSVLALDWSHNELPEELLVKILSNEVATTFPRLSHFRIGSQVGDKLLKTLSRLAGEEPSFSTLQSLELRDCTAPYPSVRAMISSLPHLRTADIKLRDGRGVLNHVLVRA